MKINDLTEKQKDITLKVLAFKQPRRLKKVLNELEHYEKLSIFNPDEDSIEDICDDDAKRQIYTVQPIVEEVKPRKTCFTELTDEECRHYVGLVFQSLPKRAEKILDRLDASVERRREIKEKQKTLTSMVLEQEVEKFKDDFLKASAEAYDNLITKLKTQ